ncbi:Thioredoxin [Oryctes borbonicus]|uniref:Thioredoxin n=1 Tax=Oryctes borbonicus TaxID=1629725 RepID=A0A0T6BH40_9SCAR|nr:Thioredoxin [Oryctes borbonicus]
MATLEDKILGEKLHNYCSSSEESDGDNSESENENPKPANAEPPPPPELNKWEGTSTNTGPKGVIKDWQRYKQLETEKRVDDEKERIELAKKFTLAVQSALDEERQAIDDPELADLLNDEFLLAYQKQRMQEMLQQSQHNRKFGNLIFLSNGQEYLDAIDKEHKNVTIVIHLYEENVTACRVMNTCLGKLSKIYENVKFCAIVGSRAGLSRDFKIKGLPALLIYKDGQIVGNFIRLSDDLGDDFCAEDVQGFLVEHGMLEDKTCTPLIIKPAETQYEDSD